MDIIGPSGKGSTIRQEIDISVAQVEKDNGQKQSIVRCGTSLGTFQLLQLFGAPRKGGEKASKKGDNNNSGLNFTTSFH